MHIFQIKGLAGQEEVKNQEIKPEVPDIIKEEIKEEVKKKEEKEVKRKEEKEAKKKEEKEIKKREEKEIKKKEEKEIKKKEEKEIKKKEEKEAKPPEVKQIKRKEEKEIKKRDEKETKEKKRAVQLAPLVEMPVLKSSKTIKIPLQQSEMPVLKSTKPPRGSGISRRTEKRTFEKEKIEKPLPSKDISHKKDFFDPILDLLEPVYEEVAKDPKPTKAIVPKDPKNITVRRNVQKKLKKRKITDDREEVSYCISSLAKLLITLFLTFSLHLRFSLERVPVPVQIGKFRNISILQMTNQQLYVNRIQTKLTSLCIYNA